MNERRISTPVFTTTHIPSINAYRSLRGERHGRVIQKPTVEAISEVESETVEKRLETSSPKQSSRPTSQTESIKKVRIEIEDETAASKRNNFSRKSSSTRSIKNDKLQITDKTLPVKVQPGIELRNTQPTVHYTNGSVNYGYTGSIQSLPQSNGSIPSVAVYREQYWSWSCRIFRCSSWTKREKVLFIVVAGLTGVVCGLVTLIGVILDKDKARSDTHATWYTWKL